MRVRSEEEGDRRGKWYKGEGGERKGSWIVTMI